MTATVHQMAKYRLVFVLHCHPGTVVFLATHAFGRGDHVAHQQTFADPQQAEQYARSLSTLVGCEICDLVDGGADRASSNQSGKAGRK